MLRGQNFPLVLFFQLLETLSQCTCLILIFQIWSLSTLISLSKVWSKTVLFFLELSCLRVRKCSSGNFKNISIFFWINPQFCNTGNIGCASIPPWLVDSVCRTSSHLNVGATLVLIFQVQYIVEPSRRKSKVWNIVRVCRQPCSSSPMFVENWSSWIHRRIWTALWFYWKYLKSCQNLYTSSRSWNYLFSLAM